jgi:hypothetical protein
MSAHKAQREQRAEYQRTLNIVQAAVAPSPDLLDRIAALERFVADQARVNEAQESRIAALEARPAVDEDGTPQPPGVWCKTAEAMRSTGYSRSGLRKLRQQNRIVVDFSGPHCLYDVTTVVRKVRKVPA